MIAGEQILQMRVANAVRMLDAIEASARNKPGYDESQHRERVANAVRIYCAILIAESKS